MASGHIKANAKSAKRLGASMLNASKAAVSEWSERWPDWEQPADRAASSPSVRRPRFLSLPLVIIDLYIEFVY
jgi:hypothetical protein